MKRVALILLILIVFFNLTLLYPSQEYEKYRNSVIPVMNSIHGKWVSLFKVLKKIKDIKTLNKYKHKLKKIFFQIADESVSLRKIVAKIPVQKQKSFLNWVLRLKPEYLKALTAVRKEKQRVLSNRQSRILFMRIQRKVNNYRKNIFKRI